MEQHILYLGEYLCVFMRNAGRNGDNGLLSHHSFYSGNEAGGSQVQVQPGQLSKLLSWKKWVGDMAHFAAPKNISCVELVDSMVRSYMSSSVSAFWSFPLLREPW